jgi:ribonuclease HI
MITGLTPIDIRIKENAQLYQITKGNKQEEVQFVHDTRKKHWLHPTISFTILEDGRDDDSSIKIYTDGCKNEKGADAGVAIFITGKHTTSLQYRLNERCTNNQSEQVAILKSLEYVQNIYTAVKKVTIYTDSQTTLDSIKNSRIHTSLIDKIRLQTWQLEQAEWNLRFCWVKAHVGTQGNELADRLAKEAATNADIAICYNKISKCAVQREIERTSVAKWQGMWNCTTKGKTTKEYFPKVAERLNMKISTNQHLTTTLTGHGNIKSCLHHFKLITSPACPCGKNDQTTDHLLYECELLKTQRHALKIAVLKSGVLKNKKKHSNKQAL